DGMPDAASALEWVSHTKGGGTQSTPVVYNGRLYLGGGGATMGSMEPFHVIDAATMTELYSVPILTKGSAGISTAYASDANNQTVYLYLVPYAPKDETTSQLWILKDHPGQTQADYEVVDGIGQRQYCSQSVLVAGDGSLLWYNDAGRLYCYENLAETLEPGVFLDTRSHWARDSIAFLAERKILNGTGGNTFSPDAPITRAQFVQMLAGLSGEDSAACVTDAFDDVKPGDWFAPAAAWAVEHGITAGSGARTFSPNAQITRQDMAVMLARYVEQVAAAELPEKNSPLTFTDVSSIAAYARDAVSVMQTAGIISGISDGASYRFAPTAQATRAQAAVMTAGLYRTLYGQD
ncbi:MAG: S-layer homology domain-containing protein, partial [Butyricicoccus sp.]